MRRVLLALVVALLTVSASGIPALAIAEPCSSAAETGHDDGTCSPTCVTCGCCAQAVEPVILPITPAVEIPVAEIVSIIPRAPRTRHRDILHVPKTLVA